MQSGNCKAQNLTKCSDHNSGRDASPRRPRAASWRRWTRRGQRGALSLPEQLKKLVDRALSGLNEVFFPSVIKVYRERRVPAIIASIKMNNGDRASCLAHRLACPPQVGMVIVHVQLRMPRPCRTVALLSIGLIPVLSRGRHALCLAARPGPVLFQIRFDVQYVRAGQANPVAQRRMRQVPRMRAARTETGCRSGFSNVPAPAPQPATP